MRRHKGRLSTFHGDDKRKKIFAPANYNQGDERDGGRQKGEKILPLSHWRDGGEVNSLHLKLEPVRGRGGDLTDVGAISGRSSLASCCHRPEYHNVAAHVGSSRSNAFDLGRVSATFTCL